MAWLRRLWDAIKYEYRYEGMAEKDGRPYKKYVKVHRMRTRSRRLALYFLIAAISAPLVYVVVARVLSMVEASLDAPPPEAEPPPN